MRRAPCSRKTAGCAPATSRGSTRTARSGSSAARKDLIIRDGRNVYPREIEDVLHGHPDVLEAAVLGVPDPLLGEEVVACVVVAAAASVTEEELRDHVRDRVAESKYPRRVWFAAALPHSGSGKVLKRAIVIPADIAAAREIAA